MVPMTRPPFVSHPALALGLLVAASAPAQELPLRVPTGSPFAVQHWTASDELPQNSVAALHRSKDGFLWVGTFGGLCRFDGTQWRIHDTAAAPELGSNRVLALAEDPDGTLWVGTDRGGVVQVDHGRFHNTPGWPGGWLGAIARLPDGRLVASSEREVFEVLPGQGYRPAFATAVPGVRRVLVLGARVLLAGATGLHEVSDGAVHLLRPGNVNDAVVGAADDLWLATHAGLFHWREGGAELVADTVGQCVHAVHRSAGGSLWYATSSQLVRWEPQRSQARCAMALTGTVRTLTSDLSGGVWAGFLNSGLLRLRHSEVAVYGAERGVPRGGQNAVAPDGQGGVWVASYAGLFRGSQQRFAPVPGIEGAVTALLPEGQDLWFATEGRIGFWSQGHASIALDAPELGQVRVMRRIGGELWFGTGTGLFAAAEGVVRRLPLHSELEREVRLLEPGLGDDLWIATAEALLHLDGDHRVLGIWRLGTDLPAGEIRAVLPQATGRTWLGLYGGGFAAVGADRRTPVLGVGRQHGLLDHGICSVVPFGAQWVVGSNRGTFVVDPDGLDAIADGRQHTLACRPLAGPLDARGEANGGFQPAGCTVADRVYLCGIDGLLAIGARGLLGALPAPPCFVDRLLVGAHSVHPFGTLALPAGDRTFVVGLGAAEFDRPGQIRFRWRLLPDQPEWRLPSFDREAKFAVDRPGVYTFEAEAITLDGHPSPQPVRLSLQVPELWTESLWVRLLAAGGLLGGAWVAFRGGAARAAGQQLRLQRLVEARTAALQLAQVGLEDRVRERTAELERALSQIEADHNQRRQLERELELLRRMESLGQLAGGVAHDFNNLLTIVLGNASLLAQDLQRQPEAAELVARIREAGERGRRMTRHLLAMASREAVAPAVHDLNQLLAGMASMLQDLLGPQCRLELAMAECPALLRCAPSQIEQILINLAVNARDAMPAGGTLRVAVACHGPRVQLEVRDTGIGMPADVRERAFEPFFTTKDRHRGTGLGLATVYGITKQLQGEVHLDSVEGHGTCFRFRWPLAEPSAERAVLVPAPPAARPLHTVLLVEDEADVRSALRTVLERAGIQVLEADSGAMAAASLAATAGQVDAVLSDVQMPGPMGVELVAALRRIRPDLPFVFVTGHTRDPGILQGLDALGIEVLDKPPQEAVLLAALRRALRQTQPSVGADGPEMPEAAAPGPARP
jgi:signal transduction histidine kinase/ligand-binding sensor domain-containing protein/CheY-like chemotaxis protein